MPRKPNVERIAAHREIELPDEIDPNLFDPAEERDDNAPLTDMLASIGAEAQGGKVVVSRLNVVNGAKKEQWLFESAPSDTLLPDLQENYGEGTYRVRVYGYRPRPDGKNYLHCFANKTIHIGPPMAGPKPAALAGVPAHAAPAAIDAAQIIREANAAMMEKLFSLLVPLLAPRERSNGLGEMKELLETMGLARKAVPEPVDPSAKLFEQFQQFATLMKTIRGADPLPVGDDGDVPTGALVVKGLEIIGDLARNAKVAQATALPQNLNGGGALPASVSPGAAPDTASAGDNAENEDVILFRAFLKRLAKAAAVGDSVDLHVGTVCDLASDDLIEQLETRADWFDELMKVESSIAPHRAWFTKLRDGIISEFAEKPEGETIGNPQSASAGNRPAA